MRTHTRTHHVTHVQANRWTEVWDWWNTQMNIQSYYWFITFLKNNILP